MRRFPETSKDTLVAFAYHSTRIERVPLNKQNIDETLSGSNINAWLSGQLTCINLVTEYARNEEFIPRQTLPHTTIPELEWMKRIHVNLMKPVAQRGEMTDDTSLIKIQQVGRWREERHFIRGITEGIEMPSPFDVPKHLHAWWTDIVDFHNQFREKINSPHLFENNDISILVDKAYETNLKICCIKPFIDGSNRVARLVENLFRLNWGLPWKGISSDDKEKLDYVDDIKEMQKKYM
jgi:hypothetical protein